MAKAKQGDTVKVHYAGRLADGSEFDSSQGAEPLRFTLGQGQVIEGFEQAVIGMKPGEAKTVDIPADEAYGPHQEEMVLKVDRSDLPAELKPEVGQQLQLRQAKGRPVVVTVTEVTDDSVTLDANHPLAGQDLTFDIELVEIEA